MYDIDILYQLTNSWWWPHEWSESRFQHHNKIKIPCISSGMVSSNPHIWWI